MAIGFVACASSLLPLLSGGSRPLWLIRVRPRSSSTVTAATRNINADPARGGRGEKTFGVQLRRQERAGDEHDNPAGRR
ncbi:hypothetical protein THAOC_27009, partial [Thalassiosira oceanica]